MASECVVPRNAASMCAGVMPKRCMEVDPSRRTLVAPAACASCRWGPAIVTTVRAE